MVVIKNMRRRRRELDFTQKTMAKMCCITQPYYAQIERGKSLPSIEILSSIVKILGLKFDDVLEVE